MMIWLDHKIFGSGRGLRTPYWDGAFYWLSGELYTFSPGLGAQLHSIQWTHPKAGERRYLCGRWFRPLHSQRQWGRVKISWAMEGLKGDLDSVHAEIRRLKSDLDYGRGVSGVANG